MVSCLWLEHQNTTSFFYTPASIRIYCKCYNRYSHLSLSIYYSSWHFISVFFLHWKDNSHEEIFKAVHFCYRYMRLNGFLTVEFIYCKPSTALFLSKLKCRYVANVGTLLLFLISSIYCFYFRALDHFSVCLLFFNHAESITWLLRSVRCETGTGARSSCNTQPCLLCRHPSGGAAAGLVH